MTKVLVIGDLHLSDKGKTTIKGYVENNTFTLDFIERLIEERKPDIIIFLGDIFDKAYRSTSLRESHSSRIRYLASKVETAYTLIGNHMFHERDDNPEFYLIQPTRIVNKSLIPLHKIFNSKAALQVVQGDLIEDVQLSFFHHDKANGYYIRERDPKAKYHIGFYHDIRCLIPQQGRQVKVKPMEHSYFQRMWANVDMAILGDIHIPMDPVMYGHTQIIVPGAPTITQNDVRYLNEYVSAPFLTLDKGSVKLELIPFPTGFPQNITVEDPFKKEVLKERRKAANAIAQEVQYASETYARSFHDFCEARNLPEYYIGLLDAAQKGILDENVAFKIITQGVAAIESK